MVYLYGRSLSLSSSESSISCTVGLSATVTVAAGASGLVNGRYLNSVAKATPRVHASLYAMGPVGTIAVYPDVVDDIKGVIPFQWAFAQQVLISNFANGTESRRASWQAPKKNVIIRYNHITRDEAQRIYDFYQQQGGPLREFSFFFPNPQSYVREYCGVYTDTLSINLPSKLTNEGSYRALYNGVSPIYNYWFNHEGAPDSGDRLVLSETPSVGDKFYWSFVGRLKLKMRFSENPIHVSEIKDRFASLSVELIGLEPEFV